MIDVDVLDFINHQIYNKNYEKSNDLHITVFLLSVQHLCNSTGTKKSEL